MIETDQPAALPDPETDRAGFLLGVCDLREKLATEANAGPWCPAYIYQAVRHVERNCNMECPEHEWGAESENDCKTWGRFDGRYVAAEANPVLALAEIALWRGIAERHGVVLMSGSTPSGRSTEWTICACDENPGPSRDEDDLLFPCSDPLLLAAVNAAQAYLTGGGR